MQGMVRLHVPAIVVFALAIGGVSPVGGQPVGPSAPEKGREVALLDLSGVRRLVAPLSRLRANLSDEEKAAAWADISQVCDAILGRPLDPAIGLDELTSTDATARGPRMAAADGVAARDARAYLLLAVGYSARETADIVSERISVEALDNARHIRAAGLGREHAANYLDREYRRAAMRRERLRQPPDELAAGPSRFDPFIEKYARAYGVDATIVRAIIEAESGYAHRYASGHAVLYGETRAYVRAVLGKLRPQALMQ